jgi:hypothetical protein
VCCPRECRKRAVEQCEKQLRLGAKEVVQRGRADLGTVSQGEHREVRHELIGSVKNPASPIRQLFLPQFHRVHNNLIVDYKTKRTRRADQPPAVSWLNVKWRRHHYEHQPRIGVDAGPKPGPGSQKGRRQEDLSREGARSRSAISRISRSPRSALSRLAITSVFC